MSKINHLHVTAEVNKFKNEIGAAAAICICTDLHFRGLAVIFRT